MAKEVQINAQYINGQYRLSPLVLYAIPTTIRPYVYSATNPSRNNSAMNAIVTVDTGDAHPKTYFTAQTVASILAAANA
jgi:hypothetical protein